MPHYHDYHDYKKKIKKSKPKQNVSLLLNTIWVYPSLMVTVSMVQHVQKETLKYLMPVIWAEYTSYQIIINLGSHLSPCASISRQVPMKIHQDHT